jgi:hypothetical protein
MKVFVTPHAVAGYQEHVCPSSSDLAEHRIRSAQRLFRCLSRDRRLILYGCRDSAGRKFIGVSEVCTLSAESITLAAIHPYWYYRETRPHWKAVGLPCSPGNIKAKRAHKRERERIDNEHPSGDTNTDRIPAPDAIPGALPGDPGTASPDYRYPAP